MDLMCLALKRHAGAQNEPFRRLIHMIRGNSQDFEAGGRVLRLKQYMPADANQAHIEAVLDALQVNDRVEALYIQNFEKVCCLWGALESREVPTFSCS